MAARMHLDRPIVETRDLLELPERSPGTNRR